MEKLFDHWPKMEAQAQHLLVVGLGNKLGAHMVGTLMEEGERPSGAPSLAKLEPDASECRRLRGRARRGGRSRAVPAPAT